jgi:hypothetical protein
MKYRILITKTLDIPQNIFHALFDTEQEAMVEAKKKLAELDGDVAIVATLVAGETKVIERFETIRKVG